ncbi:L-rhamnose/proton symporter RhaT [Silvibacterium acidisoli]|uniref:L-rhamnose/proton symporter RhaT n=1 Tax=Acidobacteriaceae bacterium ZG23-2 TaxID=2883246 RepID=UPI00406CB2E2
MNASPWIGVIYHWLGGLASASNFIPFRPIKRWSWEIYWIVQGFAAWIVAPLVAVLLLVPHPFAVISASPSGPLHTAIFWGAMWGIGGITFGLSVRYLGIALGYAISLGLCTTCGTLLPPIFHGGFAAIMGTPSGRVILLGVLICLAAIAINGFAGYRKEHEASREDLAAAGERDFSFTKGISVAVFAGVMSSCFAYGLDAGKPIAEIALARLTATHRASLWQNLPVLVVVLWGGFVTNFLWSLVLIIKNRSAGQFAGNPGSNPLGTSPTLGTTVYIDPRSIQERLTAPALFRNYILASLAGVIWYFQFFFYSMGETYMARFAFSSWALHMASIIIFATLWGIALKEWRGVSRTTLSLLLFGLFLLIASTVVIGWGDYLSYRAG